MIRLRNILLLAVTFVAVCSCGDDVPGGGSVENANRNVIGADSVCTESGFEQASANAVSRMEIPHLTGDENCFFVVHNDNTYGVNYCMEYDRDKLASRWTAFRWDASNRGGTWNRAKWYTNTFNGYGGYSGCNGPFQPDPVIPTEYQTTLADHSGNGYDRGHMIASADRLRSLVTNGQTYYLSNMHPQYNSFNATGTWVKLEEWIRDQYNNSNFCDTLYVVKGGTIRDDQIIEVKRRLVVPKYFYMVLLRYRKNGLANGGYSAIAFLAEHVNSVTSTAPKNLVMTVDELEAFTGIDFFCNLPDNIESAVERSVDKITWKVNN